MTWVGGRTPRGFRAYLSFQAPEVLLAGLVLSVLHRWVGLPMGWAIGPFALWILKDLVTYLLLRDVFAVPSTGPEVLVGARVVADERLAPEGYVRLGAERWRTEALRPQDVIVPGKTAIVRGTRGLTLLVEMGRSPGPSKRREGSDESPTGKPGQPGL